jgi:PEGA domain
MSKVAWTFLFLAAAGVGWAAQQAGLSPASAPGKTGPPRVFITDSTSWETHGFVSGSSSGFAGASHGGARPQTAEIIKTFGQRCPGVIINSKVQVSDYVVELDHEGGKGFLNHKDKVAVFVQTSGDSIFSKSTLSVGGSVQDACNAILSHWNQYSAQLRSTPAAVPASSSTTPAPAPTQVAPTQIPVASAHLSLTSKPDNAEIEVDGAFVGNTPSTLDLPPGEHDITISKKRFEEWTRKIKLTGGTVSVFAELDYVQ